MKREDLAKLLNMPQLPAYLNEADELIRSSGTPAFTNEVDGLLSGGGKRLRPALLICVATLGGEKIDKKVIKAAAAVEMIHQASLVHDAITDEKLSAAQINKNLLIGDYLLSTALRLAAAVSLDILDSLANTMQRMAEGQLGELNPGYNYDPANNIYLDVIQSKTASLFASASECGALLGGLGRESAKSTRLYGQNFGMAFQIMDDISDHDFDPRTVPSAQKIARKYIRNARSVLKTLKPSPYKEGLYNLASDYIDQALR